MYIFEIIAKLFLKLNLNNKTTNNKVFDSENQDFDEEKCNHIYLPIDSSKDYLACNNCGKVIKNIKL